MVVTPKRGGNNGVGLSDERASVDAPELGPTTFHDLIAPAMGFSSVEGLAAE
jgi:hypothetical protein